ncbi:MAG: hypothetical protein OXF44_08045 [Anaerolineaceae bacterium]|nr:hypothetical protein [Anaerolineaceae bacterium]
MSKAGERLIRSVQQALAHARGEDSGCLVIPADMSKEERLRLIERWMGPDDEGSDPELHAEESAVNNSRSIPAATESRSPSSYRQAAAPRRSA